LKRHLTVGAAAIALAAVILPADAQQADVSVELLSADSDCDTPSQVTDDGFLRQLIRCMNNGVRAFAFGVVLVDDNGVPDQFQEIVGDGIQDTIEAYADLGWGVKTAQVVDLHEPVEYNQSIPVYIFYRDDCAPSQYYCTVPGDKPGFAFLTEPIFMGTAGWEHLVPLQPNWDCMYDDGSTGPCWVYIDCDSVAHSAECFSDIANAGYTPVYPPCDTCPETVSLQADSWGRIKSLYRSGSDER